ncbi:MAG: LuxR C-terminal-related transcriptional regulator [Mycobacteriales bacterium]
MNRVLVCAPAVSDEPVVVVADGSYETDSERVFWHTVRDAEVLRLPLDAPVSVRPLHTPRQRTASPSLPLPGERALLDAVMHQRQHTEHLPMALPAADATALEAALARALRHGDSATACALAELLRAEAGLQHVYRVVTDCLSGIGQDWANGRTSVLAERRATGTAHAVVQRLQLTTKAPDRDGTVVVAAPPGDRHRLVLEVLAHLVRETGRPALVVEDLPLEELLELAAAPDTAAVVLSAHAPLAPAYAKDMLTRLRETSPDLLLVAGGSGLPRSRAFVRACGADVVTDDPAELLQALDERTSALTAREREVLVAVADGLTNAEIAERLGIAPATVKTHLDHVFAKTGTVHRAAAVARALRQGWIR